MSSQKKTITIMIVDDHPGWIEGVRTIIHKASDMQIVGEVQDGEAIKQKIAELQPDILLLDLVMPNHNPAELEKWVREKYPDVVTLVLTAHDRDAYLAGMMEAGAAGYLDKKMKANDLLDAIRRAARGEFLYDKEQMERAQRWREEVGRKWDSLSGREREVLQLLTEGTDNNGIASSLNVSIHTVEKHLKNVFKKLSVTSRTEAILWWVEKGTDFRT
jgi:NarL family two-component system response regulator LiaR